MVRQVAVGATDKEVGVALGIRPRTVQKHLEHVYAKLGVGARTAAVARLTEVAAETRRR